MFSLFTFYDYLSFLLFLQQSAEKCVTTLLDLIQNKVNYVVQEAIIVLKVSNVCSVEVFLPMVQLLSDIFHDIRFMFFLLCFFLI